MNLSQEEMGIRKSIWLALSNFYLDTELGDVELDEISLILKSSGYSFPKLQEIDRNEVAPILHPNLWSVAGEWSGFDKKWLADKILQRLQKANWKTQVNDRIFKSYRTGLTSRYWKRIDERKNILPHPS